jgi:hypothetical protein
MSSKIYVLYPNKNTHDTAGDSIENPRNSRENRDYFEGFPSPPRGTLCRNVEQRETFLNSGPS